MKLDFDRPGKPAVNTLVEALNGRSGLVCLNAHRFRSLGDAQEQIDVWCCEYNREQPHSALDTCPPSSSPPKTRWSQTLL